MIELSVVSGTYKRLPMLKAMIASVRASIGNISYEIVLVGVATDTETRAWCKAQHDIRWIEHPGLLGCNKAYADGTAAAVGEFVLLSNDDVTFVGDSIPRAVAFMRNHPDTGIGLFYTNRRQDIYGAKPHLATMPARYPDGRTVSVPYNGIAICKRWLGDKLGWWSLPGARSYGGDNYFIANALEAGYSVVGIDGTLVNEPDVDDELKQINVTPRNEGHNDSQAYLKLYPRGPELGHARAFEGPADPPRILYAPVYERGHRAQHEQKRGLRRALQRIGVVREVDYVQYGPVAILSGAENLRPTLVLTQFHSGDSFSLNDTRRLRSFVPGAKLINWNGDVWDDEADAAYLGWLKLFDLHLSTNASSVLRFREHGIRAHYWQIGYEPDGVGTAQKPDTDVVFLGSGYSESRKALARFLASLPYRVALYGNNLPASRGDTTYDFRRGRDILNRAKIVIGDGQYPDAYGFVSNRFFQSLAAGGALLLHQEFPGMTELLGFVAGTHLVTWTNTADLADKLAYYLDPAHEVERARIARAGQRECLKYHSFEVRVKQLLTMLAEIEQDAEREPLTEVPHA